MGGTCECKQTTDYINFKSEIEILGGGAGFAKTQTHWVLLFLGVSRIANFMKYYQNTFNISNKTFLGLSIL
jgi:hypothetical protein